MEKHIPSSSQTVGPFFTIGLQYLIDRAAESNADGEHLIEIRGRVLDRDGTPVPDAMLEFWEYVAGVAQQQQIPTGFRRVATDPEGCFDVKIARPLSNRLQDGREQAPHFMVLVFARGLQRHLLSRVYLESDRGIDRDPVLFRVPADRRSTLIARRNGPAMYRWDVVLQGANETVFFAW